MRTTSTLKFSLLVLLSGAICVAQNANRSISALKQLTLDELLDVEVTTVSRRQEKLGEVASGIQVVTGDAIRRSGATTVAQALRLAPNLQAAQVNSSYWLIGARGFNSNSTTSNKLLVQIDGRSVYSPLFSGTFWDTQDVFLPDVDRIEVISGPGGAMWGANAVNGVISILTKSAKDTQGTLVYAGAGNEEIAFGGVRYGGTLGEDAHFRVYAKHFDVDDTVRPNGTDARDHWVMSQTGFRADWQKSEDRVLTVQGDLYSGSIEVPGSVDGKLSGGNVLARWTSPLADGTLSVQAYYDYAWRWAAVTFADRLETLDFDAQHEFDLGRHRIVWGVNYRFWRDYVRNTPTQAFLPPDADIQLGGIFVQDEIELIPEALRLSIGAKFEHNSYSGSDFQPSLRAAWLLAPEHTVWAAMSRAVRTPSRLDRDFHQPPSPPFVIAGGNNFTSETLHAFEAGWRGKLWDKISGSITVFHHDYDNLRSVEPSSPSPFPFTFQNGAEGESNGVEMALGGSVREGWHWNASWNHLSQKRSVKSWSNDLNRGLSEISDPENEFRFHTGLNLRPNVELDVYFRHVARVPVFGSNVVTHVPAYNEVDARIGWTPRPGWELSLVGRNLLDRQHAEAGLLATRREIERSFHARCTWQF